MAKAGENLDERLAKVTIDDFKAGCYPIVVSIDEAHEVGPLGGFDSAFADLREQEVVGIYLSTTSPINYLAQPPTMIDSGRNSPDTTHVLPFTELYLDTFSSHHFTGPSTELTLDKVRSIHVAASLGRPLWSAQLQTENQYPPQLLLDLAANKLTGTIKNSFMQASGQSALLCSRLLIHHTQNQAGRDLSKTLVASHLGFAFMSSPDRSTLNVGYPPEPFVSAAAVRKTPRDYSIWVSWLKDMIISDYISRGDRGELISRVLLTIARDLAWRDEVERMTAKTHHQSPMSALPGHEPVPVCGFLKYFVGEKGWDTVANAKPINFASDKSQTLKDFLGERAVVDFTCFGIAKDDSAFTYKGMVRALCQGAAVVCKPNQRSYDSLIVFLLDRRKPFTEDNLGLILVQDKNTTTRQNPILDPTKLPCGDKFPIISILHQPAQAHRVTIGPAPERQSDRLPRSTARPLYVIHVDGTELLKEADLLTLLAADDPLQRHREGSVLAEDSHAIIEHNRYYTVSYGQQPDSFDNAIMYP